MCIFNKSVLSALSNFIPHATILCDDKDHPWFKSRIKYFLQAKNNIFKNHKKNKINLQLLNKLNFLQRRLNGLITISKKNYYYERITNKLNNLQRNCKRYWSLLKGFLNNKKILLLSPLFHEKKFVTNFFEKAELFNSFFSKQCSLINNGSTLPTHIQYLTNNRLSFITFSQDDIAKIIQNLDSGKAHGHDNISILMLKMCGSAIYKSLAIIFKQCVDTAIFSSEWKKGNIVPIHEKSDKQTLKDDRPVSLLPICGKILERSKFFLKTNLFRQTSLVLNQMTLASMS